MVIDVSMSVSLCSVLKGSVLVLTAQLHRAYEVLFIVSATLTHGGEFLE